LDAGEGRTDKSGLSLSGSLANGVMDAERRNGDERQLITEGLQGLMSIETTASSFHWFFRSFGLYNVHGF
jgi:hypothetical protein